MHPFVLLDLEILLFPLPSSFLYASILLFTCQWLALVANSSYLLYVCERQSCLITLFLLPLWKPILVLSWLLPPHPPPPIMAESLNVFFWIVFVSSLEMKNIHISSLFSPATVSCWFLNSSWWLCSLKLALCSQDEVHHRLAKGNITAQMEIASILCRLFAILFAFPCKVAAEKRD